MPEGDDDDEEQGDAPELTDDTSEALVLAEIDGLAEGDNEELGELDAEVEEDTQLDAAPLLENAPEALPHADADTLADADADAEPLCDAHDADDSTDGLGEPVTVSDAEALAEVLALLEVAPDALPRDEMDALPEANKDMEAQPVALALPEFEPVALSHAEPDTLTELDAEATALNDAQLADAEGEELGDKDSDTLAVALCDALPLLENALVELSRADADTL